MSQQLVKKKLTGGYENVMPKSWIEAIKDKNTGQTLVEILQGFNMYFLSYNGNTSATRCLVPKILRKKGLWITYVKYDGNVYTEWYAADGIDDKSWGDNSNWRIGNNTLVGDITISANGNWVINGTETEFKAVGEKGNTPLIRVANNRLQVSYDLGDTYRDVTNNPVYTKFRWSYTTGDTQNNIVGRLQSSVDEGKTWTNMSNDFTNNLHIKKYVGANESLPTSGIAEGTIYAKGPTYAVEDTSHSNPIYRLWVYAWKGNTLAWQDNGEFTSITAGIVQETGSNENAVMSQKATSEAIHGVLYDVSSHNNSAAFESLQSLLSSSDLNTLIPTSVRHGGMSIRFIHSSDNNYVQYRLMSDTFNTTPANWQNMDYAPSVNMKPQLFLFAESSNYINLITTESTLKLNIPSPLTAVFGNSIEVIAGGIYDVAIMAYTQQSNCFLVYNKSNGSFVVRVGRILSDDYLIAGIRNDSTITSSTTNLSIESYKSFAIELAVNGKFKGDRLAIAEKREYSHTLPTSYTLYNTYKQCKNNVQFSYGLLDFISASCQIKVNDNSVLFLDNTRFNISSGTYDIDKTSLISSTSTYILCIVNTDGTLSFKFVTLNDITALNENVYVLSIIRMHAASGSMSPSVVSVVVEYIDNSILVDGLPLFTSNTLENSNTKIASSHSASLADRFAHFEARCIRIAASAMTVVCDFSTYLRCGYNLVNLTPGQYTINVSYCDKNRTDYILCVDANKGYNVFTNVFYLIPHPYYNATQLPENFYVVCFIKTEEPVTTSSTSMVVKTISEDILVNRKLLSYAQDGIDKNNEELRDSNKYIRRISGKYSYILAHFGGGGMLADHPISTQGGNNRYLPEYGMTNIMLAKQMGFDGLGINVHSTSDNVLVCCHDASINRTFRNKSDYSVIAGTVNIADHTYAELVNGYVCETQIERLREPIMKLEDVIITCKNINMGIAILPSGSIMTMVKSLMDKYDFTDWMFIGGYRPAGAGLVMYITPANKTAQEIVSALDTTISKPASCLFEVTALSSYTEAQIQEIAEACHNAGYGVAIDCYGSKQDYFKFKNWGCFDITSVDNEIPSFENGNYISLSSVADFSEFTCSDASTVDSGVLPIGKTISYYGQEKVKDLVGVTLKVQFEGTINLTFGQGYNSVEFTSNGSKEEVFTNIFFDEYVGFEIEAVTSTKIQNIKFDAKR